MLRAYAAERLPLRVFIPLSLVLAAAAHAGRASSSFVTLIQDAVTIAIAIAQFRLWDDLADRGHDATAHPDRVLVRTSSIGTARAACIVLGLAVFVLLAAAYPHRVGLALFVGLNGAAAWWYARRGARSTIRDHVLLTKYPALVAIIAIARGVDRPAFLLCSGAAVYLAACLYEAVHDVNSPAAHNRPLLLCEAGLLVLASTAAAIGAFL